MQLQLLKSKIHNAFVTEANIDYIGSITIDEDLMDAVDLIEGEQVRIVFPSKRMASFTEHVVQK